MTKRRTYDHVFTDTIPDLLDDGILYVSVKYATAAHLCMCGCGNEATTPLAPERWKMTFDGRTVSLSPSVGNWSFACESHYILKKGRVQWAGHWSKEQVAAGRSRTRARLEASHGSLPPSAESARAKSTKRRSLKNWLRRLWP